MNIWMSFHVVSFTIATEVIVETEIRTVDFCQIRKDKKPYISQRFWISAKPHAKQSEHEKHTMY